MEYLDLGGTIFSVGVRYYLDVMFCLLLAENYKDITKRYERFEDYMGRQEDDRAKRPLASDKLQENGWDGRNRQRIAEIVHIDSNEVAGLLRRQRGRRYMRARFCSRCGAPTVPGANFCTNCGHRLADETERRGSDAAGYVTAAAAGAVLGAAAHSLLSSDERQVIVERPYADHGGGGYDADESAADGDAADDYESDGDDVSTDIFTYGDDDADYFADGDYGTGDDYAGDEGGDLFAGDTDSDGGLFDDDDGLF